MPFFSSHQPAKEAGIVTGNADFRSFCQNSDLLRLIESVAGTGARLDILPHFVDIIQGRPFLCLREQVRPTCALRCLGVREDGIEICTVTARVFPAAAGEELSKAHCPVKP